MIELESPFPTKKSAQSASVNADQVECDAFLRGKGYVTNSVIDDSIAYDNLSDEYDIASNPDGNADWSENDDARETAIGFTIIELERRIELMEDHYPFSLSDDKSALIYLPKRSKSLVYPFCLALSVTTQSLTSHPAVSAVREFERLVGKLLRSYLHGDTAHWYRTGAPALGDRPTQIIKMIKDLYEKTSGEWRFSPPEGADEPESSGDDGIDVIAWKKFGKNDKRIGGPFLLAQCACGDENYVISKCNELNPAGFQNNWCGVISHAGYLKCLATPLHVSYPKTWRESTSNGGIILDRARLTWVGEEYQNATESAAVKNILKPLCEMLIGA